MVIKRILSRVFLCGVAKYILFMCAIIGVVGEIPSKKKIEEARDTMAHRGPDGAGVYYSSEDNIALGHRRLSIIDLSSAGSQPFFSDGGRFIIVFNGEIYNYLELKNELKERYRFRTDTDTEVLLASYAAWGEKCLQKINGMFSFAIWDTKEKKLFCARDRLGEKPLFYFFKDGTFYFSSEIKGLLALGTPAIPNEEVISDYLHHGLYDHTNNTFFSEIYSLRAGHYLTWKSGRILNKQYWSLDNIRERTHDLEEDIIQEEYREILSDSIRIRFRSDVPVGINLSSGIDSNSLLYYSKKILKEDINTFSFCYGDEKYNECKLIERHLSEGQKRRWHTEMVDPHKIIDEAATMNAIQDQPFGGIPALAHAHLFQLASSHNTVVLLEGQGGDELLAGYEYYRLEYEKDKRKEPLKDESPSLSLSQDTSLLVDESIFNQKFLKRMRDLPAFLRPFSSHLLNAQYRDLVYTKLPRVLRFHDHMSMAYGRELRLPYLDYRFVEFCFSLPALFKINESSQKVLMREAMKDYLPGIVESAPKKAFSAVQGEWFRRYYKNVIYDILTSPSFRGRPYWDNDNLMRKADLFFSGKGDNSFFLWQCVNLELWFRKFVD